MGVEWEIGCEHCRQFVWLGSQKPASWEGFQMGNDYVERFLGLHAYRSDRPCQLVVYNDGSAPSAPWEEDNEGWLDWKEDILSRNFWDSFSNKQIQCGNCSKTLVYNLARQRNRVSPAIPERVIERPSDRRDGVSESANRILGLAEDALQSLAA